MPPKRLCKGKVRCGACRSEVARCTGCNMHDVLRRTARAGRALSRLARRVGDRVPPTPLGLLLAAGAWLGLTRVALPDQDLVLLVACYGMLGLVGAAVLTVIIGALWLKLRVRAVERDEPLRMETGRVTETGFAAPSLGWLPLVQVRWEWVRPPGVTVSLERRFGRLRERVTATGRGEIADVERRFVVGDAFGLARLGVRLRERSELLVLPHVGGLARMPVLWSLAGGDEMPHPMGLDDGDRMELRRYLPGDPARMIHWKVFGRTRKLMVRVPERALSRARRTVAYLVAGPGDEASAAAARSAVASDAFGAEWIFSADGAGADARAVDDALRLIARSVGARDRGAQDLFAFVQRVERDGPASLIVFVPPEPGEWLGRLAALLARRRGSSRVVIGVDGLALGRPPWLERVLTFGASRAGTPRERLDETLRVLSSVRCDVVVLDRATGRRVGRGRGRALRARARAA